MVGVYSFGGVALPVFDFAGDAFKQPCAFAWCHARIELGFGGEADLTHGPTGVFFEAAGFLVLEKESSPCSR